MMQEELGDGGESDGDGGVWRKEYTVAISEFLPFAVAPCEKIGDFFVRVETTKIEGAQFGLGFDQITLFFFSGLFPFLWIFINKKDLI